MRIPVLPLHATFHVLFPPPLVCRLTGPKCPPSSPCVPSPRLQFPFPPPFPHPLPRLPQLIVATGKARGPWVREVFPRLNMKMPGVFLQVGLRKAPLQLGWRGKATVQVLGRMTSSALALLN